MAAASGTLQSSETFYNLQSIHVFERSSVMSSVLTGLQAFKILINVPISKLAFPCR